MSPAVTRTFRQVRLATGFAFLVAFVLLAGPTTASVAGALPLLAGGLGLRAWAAGHLVKRKTLTQSGPYAHTRNPLYLGSLLLLLGACTAASSPVMWAVFVPLYAVIHAVVIRGEQDLARASFPSEFGAYAARVPAFLPSWTPRVEAEGRWSARQYLRNGEYNAGLGVLLALAFLLLRLAQRV